MKIRLHGDVPIAAYVSGGLDSSAILGIVTKILGREIRSFNIRFDHSDYDESHLSKQVADFLGVTYVPVDASADVIADNFANAVYHNEGLIYNNQSVAKFVLSKAVSQAGYKVVLTGEGADEILAGYPFFREDLLRHESQNLHNIDIHGLRAANASVSHVFLSDDESLYNLDQVFPFLNYIPSMWRVGARYGNLFKEKIYSKDFRVRIEKRNPHIELIKSLEIKNILQTHPINRSLYLWSKTNLPEVILSFLGDRMEMAHSIEGRLPFLDHRLAQYCQRLKINAKIFNQKEKYILREAVKDIIPDFIYNRQKFPFSAPPVIGAHNIPTSRLQSMMFDILHSQKMKSVPFYDQNKLVGYLNALKDKPQKERAVADPVINRAVSAAVLADRFKISS